MATFGALGAALIGSLQLVGLEATAGADRVLALIGFGLGLFGASLVVVLMGGVLASTPRAPKGDTLEHADVVAAAEKRGAWVLGGYGSAQNLDEAWRNATETRQTAYDSYLNARDEKPRDKQKEEEEFRKHEAAAYRADMALSVVQRLHTFADLHEVRRRFDTAVLGLAGGIVAAGVGVALFAMSVAASAEAGDPAPAETAIAARSAPAMLRIDEDALDRYEETFGASCDLREVGVLVLGVLDDGYDLVALPAGGCEPVRARIPESDGLVVGMDVDIEGGTRPPEGEN